MKIPDDELRTAEAKCNALIALGEEYHHVIRSLESTYGSRISERRVRRIVGGGAGPENMLLEEDVSENVA